MFKSPILYDIINLTLIIDNMGEAIVMIHYVNNELEMTTLEARKTYRGKYIGFLVTKSNPKGLNHDNWTGRVLYTAETYNEQYEIPVKTEDGRRISLLYGMGVKDLPQGGVSIVYKEK